MTMTGPAPTFTTPATADHIPAGWWVASNTRTGLLEWGLDGRVWGDELPAACLDSIVEDMRIGAGQADPQ